METHEGSQKPPILEEEPQEIYFLRMAKEKAATALRKLIAREEDIEWVLGLFPKNSGTFTGSYEAGSNENLIAEIDSYLSRDSISPDDTLEMRKEALRTIIRGGK